MKLLITDWLNNSDSSRFIKTYELESNIERRRFKIDSTSTVDLIKVRIILDRNDEFFSNF